MLEKARQTPPSGFSDKRWEKRLFRINDSGPYYVKLQRVGHRDTFNLETANRAEAASKAKQIYMELRTLGWDATLAKRKPRNQAPSRTEPLTVGDLLSAIRETYSGRQRTLAEYFRQFRRIVSDVNGLDLDDSIYDPHPGGGRERWIVQLDKISLASVTPQAVERWKAAFLKRAGNDFTLLRSARISVNSAIRMGSALFSPKRLKAAGLTVPNPFAGIEYEREPDLRYYSKMDAEAILRDAMLELRGDREEELKMLLLGLLAGLRRNEIDKLEWSAFLWDESAIYIGPTRYLQPKSEKSIGNVDLDPEMLALFRGFHARARSNFVVEATKAPRINVGYVHYRTLHVAERLVEWLRSKGIESRTPLHTLRKEFGSLICDKHGIFAASAQLRHGDISVTRKYYVGKKSRTPVGLGNLLAGTANVEPLPQPAEFDEPLPRSLNSA